MGANNDKRIKSIDSIETYVYVTGKNVICKNEEIKCNYIIKHYKND